jgi:hypothetical protein
VQWLGQAPYPEAWDLQGRSKTRFWGLEPLEKRRFPALETARGLTLDAILDYTIVLQRNVAQLEAE